jgi:hypothetical protein
VFSKESCNSTSKKKTYKNISNLPLDEKKNRMFSCFILQLTLHELAVVFFYPTSLTHGILCHIEIACGKSSMLALCSLTV